MTTAIRAWRTPLVVITASCLISFLGFGPRSVLGLFLEPMTATRGWGRETFAFALATQNLLWGATVPVASALSDRYGPSRILAIGGLIYAIGLIGMSQAQDGFVLTFTAGILTGIGIGFASFSIALSAIVKVISPERRSFALGLGMASGSLGQVLFSPFGQALIANYGWTAGLYGLAASVLLIVVLVFALPASDPTAADEDTGQSLRSALLEARAHRGYVLLTLGFFVCGFHVAFITVHFPAYLQDLGMGASIGAWSLSLIGLFNIIGSFGAGVAGQYFSKRLGLSFIYFARTLAIVALLVLPKTEPVVLMFAGVMGLLWLSTVPLTSGIVLQVFGVRYMATLFGFVFFSHQLGSFSGVWLGGYLYDRTGSYDGMWLAAVAFGVLATVLHLPIDERPLARLRPAEN